MLKILQTMNKVSFSELKNVYSQSIAKDGDFRYPYLATNNRLLEAEQDFYSYLKIFYQIPGAYLGIWLVNDRYMSAVRIEPYYDGMLISGLETAPDHHKKGYATALLSAVTNDNPCVRFYSHVSKENVASLAVHNKAGFTVLADYARYIDGSVDYKSYTLVKNAI